MFSFVFLGFIDTLFNVILNNVLGWIASILGKLIKVVLEEAVLPILKWVLDSVLPIIITLLKQILCKALFAALTMIFGLIDTMQHAFDVLLGISNVTYTSPATHQATEATLLEAMFELGSVRTALWSLIILAVGLTILFSIYAVARSAFDIDMEGKRPVSAVLKSVAKTVVMLVLMPAYVLVGIRISGIILTAINDRVGTNKTCPLGGVVFLIGTMEAANESRYNQNQSFTDELRNPFYVGDKDYKSTSVVEESFSLVKYDFLVAGICAFFMLYIMANCLLAFVQRLYDVILLSLVSPFFVCTMPIDDGSNYGKWKDMFLAKLFTGFGSAIMLRVYLMLLPVVMSNDIDFSTTDDFSNTENFIIKIMFVMGGAWSVLKSGPMLTTILNIQAGMAESAARDFTQGMLSNVKKKMWDDRRGKSKKEKKQRKEEEERKGNEEFDKKREDTEKYGNFDARPESEREYAVQPYERPEGVNNSGILEGSERRGSLGRIYGQLPNGKEVLVSGFSWSSFIPIPGVHGTKHYSYDNDGNVRDVARTTKFNFFKTVPYESKCGIGRDGKFVSTSTKVGPLEFSRQSNGKKKLTKFGKSRYSYVVDRQGNAEMAYKYKPAGLFRPARVERTMPLAALKRLNREKRRGAAQPPGG